MPQGSPIALFGRFGLALGHDQTGDGILNRILIVPASYPPVLGGVQTVAHRLARHLAERNCTVEVLTRRKPRSLASTEPIDGIPVTRRRFLPAAAESVRKGRIDLALISVLGGPGDRRALRTVLERLQPDTVNIHFPEWQVDLIPLIRTVSSPRLVVSLHGDEVMRAVRGDVCQRDRLAAALTQADRVTACSGWLLEQACPLAPGVAEKAIVTSNGIDSDRFKEVDGMPHPKPYILGFGRFVAKKGFDLLIDAFAAIEGISDLDLVLVGSGPEMDRLIRLSADRGISERVVFPGRAFEYDMAKWIRGARAAVVPSREEPFGIAGLEVLAAGVPLVATRVGGMAEVMGEFASEFRSVVLCEPDSKALAAAIHEALEVEPDGESLTSLTERVRSEYSWTARMKVYEDILLVQATDAD